MAAQSGTPQAGPQRGPVAGMMAPVSYDGRRFRPAELPPGAPDPATGHYRQDGDLVWAEFAGSGVRAGWLVGTCAPDGVINASYCLVTSEGEAVAGGCVSTPSVLPDGRVRLTEYWRRLDGSAGVSRIEEIIE